jgi:hypothetical protein
MIDRRKLAATKKRWYVISSLNYYMWPYIVKLTKNSLKDIAFCLHPSFVSIWQDTWHVEFARGINLELQGILVVLACHISYPLTMIIPTYYVLLDLIRSESFILRPRISCLSTNKISGVANSQSCNLKILVVTRLANGNLSIATRLAIENFHLQLIGCTNHDAHPTILELNELWFNSWTSEN